MGALIRGNADGNIVNVNFAVFLERLFEEHGLCECPDSIEMVHQAHQPVAGIVSPVCIEIVRQTSAFRVGRPAFAKHLVQRRQPLHIPLEHLLPVAIAVRIAADLNLEQGSAASGQVRCL